MLRQVTFKIEHNLELISNLDSKRNLKFTMGLVDYLILCYITNIKRIKRKIDKIVNQVFIK